MMPSSPVSWNRPCGSTRLTPLIAERLPHARRAITSRSRWRWRSRLSPSIRPRSTRSSRPFSRAGAQRSSAVEAAVVADPNAGHHAIRGAELGDAAVIADLVRLAFTAQPRPTNPPSSALKETAAAIADHLARGGGAVLASGGAVLGVLLSAAQDRAPFTRRLAVDPVHTGAGSP